MIRQYFASRNSQRQRSTKVQSTTDKTNELHSNANATMESFGNEILEAPVEKSPKLFSKRLRRKSVDAKSAAKTKVKAPSSNKRTTTTKSSSVLSSPSPSKNNVHFDDEDEDSIMDRLPDVSEKEHRLISHQIVPLDPSLESMEGDYTPPPLPPDTKQQQQQQQQRLRRQKRSSSQRTRYDSTHLKETLEAVTNTQSSSSSSSSFQPNNLVYQQSSTGHRYDATPEKPAAVKNTNNNSQSTTTKTTNKYGLMRIIDSESESEDDMIFGNQPHSYDSSTDEESLSSRNHRVIARKKTAVTKTDPQPAFPGSLYTNKSPSNSTGPLWDLYADDSSSGYSSVDEDEEVKSTLKQRQAPPQQQSSQPAAAVVVNIRQRKPLSVQIEERPPTPPQSPTRVSSPPRASAVVISTKRYKQSAASPARSSGGTPKSKVSANVKNAAASIGGHSVRSSPSTRGSSRAAPEEETQHVVSCPVSVDDDDDDEDSTNGTATNLFVKEIPGSATDDSFISPLSSPIVGTAIPGTPLNKALQQPQIKDNQTTTSKTKALDSSQQDIAKSTPSLMWSDRIFCTFIFACGVVPCIGTWYFFQELVVARPLSESVLLLGCNALTLVCCAAIVIEIIYRSKTSQGKLSKYGASTYLLRQPFQLVRKKIKLRRRIKKEESQKASLQSKILAASANERLLKRRTQLLERTQKVDHEIVQRQKGAVAAVTFESLIDFQDQNPKRQLKATRNLGPSPTSSSLGKIRSTSPQERALKSNPSMDSSGSAASGSSFTSSSSLKRLLGPSGRDKAMEVIPQRLAQIPGVTVQPSPLWRQRHTTIADIFQSVLTLENRDSSPAAPIISYSKPLLPRKAPKDTI